MSFDAQSTAAEALRDLRAVMPKDSIIVKRLTDSFNKFTTEIETLKFGRSLAALSDYEEVNWRDKVCLGKREMEVLRALQTAGKRGLTTDGILSVVFSDKPESQMACRENIGVHIHRIRLKFKAEGLADPIETMRGFGYRISTFPRTDAEMGKCLNPKQESIAA